MCLNSMTSRAKRKLCGMTGWAGGDKLLVCGGSDLSVQFNRYYYNAAGAADTNITEPRAPMRAHTGGCSQKDKTRYFAMLARYRQERRRRLGVVLVGIGLCGLPGKTAAACGGSGSGAAVDCRADSGLPIQAASAAGCASPASAAISHLYPLIA